MGPAKPITESSLRYSKESVRKRKLTGKKASFDTVLASAAGGGTLVGSFGGVPGTFVGMVVGGLLGFYFSKNSNDC